MHFGKNTRRNMVAVTAFLATSVAASLVNADACDYRLSKLIGGGATAGTVGGAGTVAAAGTAAKAAGYYTLVHSTSGAYMLGSTVAGGSAAGTTGIIAGTGTGIGAVAAVITAPVTIIAASVVAVGTGAFEGVCYFQDERITDFDEVLERLKLLEKSNPDHITINNFWSSDDTTMSSEDSTIIFYTPSGKLTYKIAKLYIVNGVLMHRDWGRNTVVGKLAFVKAEQSGEDQN